MTSWADKIVLALSGGMKRRLQVAIAVIGDTPLMFLDEPSAGVDPVAKKFLWNVLTQLMKKGQSIVLTSHNMEEIDALCSRIAIMVNGSFECLGTRQNIQSRYGQGFEVVVTQKPSSSSEEANIMSSQICSRVVQEFPGASAQVCLLLVKLQ